VAAALEDATIFPTPVAGTEGRTGSQIGTEGGFLPAPVVVPAQPTTWVNDPTVFNAGNVDQHSLLTPRPSGMTSSSTSRSSPARR
jgi:hypothetical protein